MTPEDQRRLALTHDVGLESVQRAECGLLDQTMVFDATTVAAMLQRVAECSDDQNAFYIRGVINALTGRDTEHRLVLQRVKRGRFISPDQRAATWARNDDWLHSLATHERAGMKVEAAIALIAEGAAASRATVFAGIAEAERACISMADTYGEPNQNPRLAKE